MKNFPIKITEDIIVDGENMKGKTVWHSRSCATAIFVFSNMNDEWCVAAVKRGPGCPNNIGKWCCPCGYVDYNETVQEAAARELLEETSLQVGDSYYDLHLDFKGFNSNPEDDVLQNITFYYAGLIRFHFKPQLSKVFSEKDECDDLAWIPLADVNKYDWVFGHDKLIFEMFRKL